MSDSENNDQAEETDGEDLSASVPEGMRVVRKRRKRKSESSSRQTLYLKKREILREMQTEDDPLSVKAQVERLKEVAKQEEVPMEDKWGSSSHRRRGSRWVMLAVLVVALPVVVLLVVMAVTQRPSGVTTDTERNLLNLDEPVEAISAFDRTSPQAWFHENSLKAYDLAIELLEKCNDARNPAQLSGMVRNSEQVLRRVTVTQLANSVDFKLNDPRDLRWEYADAEGTGYMILEGKKVDFTPFRAYFVKTDEGMKIDWEATHGLSETPVASLVEEAPATRVLVRGWVGKQPHFDVDKGRASTRSWFVVLEPSKEAFVWAYAPTGSELDLRLRDILSYGRMVEAREDEVRVALRLSKPTLGFRENEFEIQELVVEDWVMP